MQAKDLEKLENMRKDLGNYRKLGPRAWVRLTGWAITWAILIALIFLFA